MKMTIKKIKGIMRSDNLKTWLPICGSFIGIYVSAVVGLLVEKGSFYTWIPLVIFAFCSIVFLILSYRYFGKWHSIIAVLRRKAGAMLQTIRFIACFEKSKYKNTGFNITKIRAKYKFCGDPEKNSRGENVYEFSIIYDIIGRANEDIEYICYNFISSKRSKPKITCLIIRGNQNIEQTDITYKNDIADMRTCIFYGRETAPLFKNGDNIHYRITAEFNKECGMPAHEKQRLLICPQNFSIHSDGAELDLTIEATEKFKNEFDPPRLYEYINGLNDVADEPAGFNTENFDSRILLQRKWRCKRDSIFATEFCKKKDHSN